MIPHRLKISGFLSYREPAELDFSGIHLACISGSNGAGKSSLLDAITWALFGQARRKDDSVINTSPTVPSAEVIFDFFYENNLYRVQRVARKGKTGSLEFYISVPDASGEEIQWKTISERSIIKTEQIIEQTLRMDYETFTNASFFLQGRADQFTQQRATDRKRILGSILGLETWEKYKDRTAQARRSVEEEINVIDGALREIEHELAEEPKRVAHLEALLERLQQLTAANETQSTLVEQAKSLKASLDEQRRMLKTMKTQLDALHQAEAKLSAQVQQRQQEYDAHQQRLMHADAIKTAYQNWLDARQQLEVWETSACAFHRFDERRHAPRLAIETERARLTHELENLQMRQKALEHANSQKPLLNQQHTAALQAVQDLQKQLEERSTLEQARNELMQSLAKAQGEKPLLKAEMDDLKHTIDQLEKIEGAVCPLCAQPLSLDERKNLIAHLTAQGTERGDRYRQNLALLKTAEQQQLALNSELQRFAGLDETLRDAQRRADQTQADLDQLDLVNRNWQEQEAPRLAELQQTLETGDFALPARAELAAVDAELKALGYDAEAHEQIKARELAGRRDEEEFHQLEKAQAALTPLQRELTDLNAQLQTQRDEAAALQQSCDVAEANLNNASAALPDVDRLENDLLDGREQENQLRIEVGGARQKVNVLDDQRKKRQSLLQTREALTQKTARLKVLERSFGKDGVQALLIEQELPEIEKHANDILGKLTNDVMSVKFITQRSYKDASRADMKETLDIRISDSTSIDRDYELFSGGEAFRINFAIRLALSRVLAQRAGARLQTLVIDEGFGSQDVEGRQRLIEAINMIQNEFEKILVITHLDELKDAFPSRIEVEKTERGSQIVVLQG